MKQRIMVISVFVFLSIYTIKINAQNCSIIATSTVLNTTGDTAFICVGNVLDLNSNGYCGLTLMYEDFNTGQLGAGWTSNCNPQFNNPCDLSPNMPPDPYCWVGSTVTQPRRLTTVTYTGVSDLCTICFDMDYGKQGDPAPCEGPDMSGEGIHLQYSTNGGAYWTDIDYWDSNGGNDTSVITWHNHCVNIPSAVTQSMNVKFSWFQDVASGNSYDHWGIDDIVITCPNSGSYGVANWTGPVGSGWSYSGFNPPAFVPTVEGWYVVHITDTAGIYASNSDSIYVVIDNGLNFPVAPIYVTATDTNVCVGSTTTLNYVGGAGTSFKWYRDSCNGHYMGAGNNLIISPIITTTYYGRWEKACGNSICKSVTINVKTVPYAPGYVSTSDSIICLGSSVVLSYNGGGPDSIFKWYSDNLTTYVGSGNNLTITPTETKYYYGQWENSCGVSQYKYVRVNVDTLPIIDAGANQTITVGNSTTLNGTVFGGTSPITYNWSPSTSINGSNTVLNPNTTALNTTTLYTFDVSARACSTSDQVVVTVMGGTFSCNSIIGQDSICLGDSTYLYALASGGSGNYTYLWTPTTGLSDSTIANPKASPLTTTLYTVHIYDSTDTVSNLVNITVNNNISMAQSFVYASDTIICAGTAVDLSYNGGSGTSFNWYSGSCGGSFVGTGNNLTVNPTSTTIYYGRWESSCGNSICDTITIFIEPTLIAPTLVYANDTNICAGVSTNLNYFGGNGNNFKWYANSCGGTPVGIGNNINVTPVTTTTYYGRWENSCSNSNCKIITVDVNTNPVSADFSYSQTGLMVDFTSLATNANNWNWNFDDGNTSTTTNPTHTYLSGGTYNVILKVKDYSNCVDSITKTIGVVVGVKSNTTNNYVNIYPNPNNGQFEVKVVSNDNEDISINMFNISGQIVYSEKIAKTKGEFTHKINTNTLAKGLYNIQIIRNNNVTNKTIIIK